MTLNNSSRQKGFGNKNVGKELDVLCTGGKHAGTTFLPVSSVVSQEIADILGVTAYYIPSGADSARNSELESPREIPIMEYTPEKQDEYWKWALKYAELHNEDTNPRLFGMTEAINLPHYISSLDSATKSITDDQYGDKKRALDLPLYTVIQSEKAKEILQDSFFESISAGITQGIIVRSPDDLIEVNKRWQEFRSTFDTPELHARPFIGLQMSTEDIIKCLSNLGDIEIDTIIPTDTPTLEQARQIREMHMHKMQKNSISTKQDDPFESQDSKQVFVIAIVDVQGSARKELAALFEACEHIKELNIEVHLVENGKQINSVNPDAIVLPGGWHKIQFNDQKELGINTAIIDLISNERAHVLALCAGSIQMRSAGNEDLLSELRSKACAPGTAFGLFDMSVSNNALSGEKNVLGCIHTPSLPENQRSVRVFEGIPFSNAPYFPFVNLEELDIIFKESTNDNKDAFNIDDDNGDVLGVQVKQENGFDPVRIAASFHDKIIFTVFLNEIALWQEEANHNGRMQNMRNRFHEREIEM